ncbi:MAG: B12-binding domain-containing radical SAM protein [Clostridia bacterium]
MEKLKEKALKVLCCIPPYIPSYFNAGHHLPIYQIADYLRKCSCIDKADCVDSSVMRHTWRDVCRILVKKYDVIILFNDFDGIDTFQRFIYYVRKISKETKILTLGRLSIMAQHVFTSLDVDAIGVEGDYEVMAASYCEYLTGLKKPKGVSVKQNGVFHKMESGERLLPEQWGKPDYNEIPIQQYISLYQNDNNKFCGIPDKRELTVQISRGCPYNCSYCDVQIVQGKRERRLSVDSLFSYLKNEMQKKSFDYVSFYAPVFTLDQQWVKQFCSRKVENNDSFKWKCVTTIDNLNEEIIRIMGQAGCFRISVGIESIISQSQKELIKNKQLKINQLIILAKLCMQLNIQLNCFIMVGFPDESTDDVRDMLQQLKQIPNLRVRPTIYTPYERMQDVKNLTECNKFNRQLFYNDRDYLYEQKIYQLLYTDENYSEMGINI